MSEPEWSNADIDEYYDYQAEINEREETELEERIHSDAPLTMAINATRDD